MANRAPAPGTTLAPIEGFGAPKWAAERAELAQLVMQRVAACSWCPFKLGEIVTLERCLYESSLQDARVLALLRKLAHQSWFVEPQRRREHLARSAEERQRDSQLMAQAESVRRRSELELRPELSYWRARLESVAEGEFQCDQETNRLQTEIAALERESETLARESELVRERLQDSFRRNAQIVNEEIPQFIHSVRGSDLLRQVHSLNKCYRRCLVRLVRSEHPLGPGGGGSAAPLADHLLAQFRVHAAKRLAGFRGALAALLRDLALVLRVLSVEVANEEQQQRRLEQHTAHLSGPRAQPPSWTPVIGPPALFPPNSGLACLAVSPEEERAQLLALQRAGQEAACEPELGCPDEAEEELAQLLQSLEESPMASLNKLLH